MTISLSCGECGEEYRVRDEAAGKKLKCKACGSTLTVPSAESGGEDDFLSGLNAATRAEKRSSKVSDDDDEFGAIPAPAAPRKSSTRKPAARSQSSGGNGGSGIGRIVGGVVAGLFLLGLGIKIVTAVVGNLPGGFGANWQTFNHPGGAFKVDMPGVAKKKVMPGMANGRELWGVDGRKYACAVLWGPLPPEVQAVVAVNPDVIFDGVAEGARVSHPGAQVKSITPVSVGGFPGREITVTAKDQSSVLRMFVANGSLYGTEFTFRGGTPPSDITKFHDSFQFTFGGAAPANPGGAPVADNAPPANAPAAVPVNDPAATTPQDPVNQPPGAPGGARRPSRPGFATSQKPYLERRKGFQTRLVKSGKAPQEADDEPLPPGVTQVAYPSGSLSLKAWVKKPAQGGPKFPVLVYFHGGFAFGMEDLDVCQPFLDAGYLVMAPTTRGENGNPGNFELFFGEIDDAKAACQWIGQQPDVDPDRIYTFGHSVGGGISSVLSLMDDVPIRHGGSSGGLYDETTFIQWSDVVPFHRGAIEETKLRILIGNVAHMQKPHYAFIGSTDFAFHGAEIRAKNEVRTDSRLTTERAAGDHMSSLDPAIRRYLEICRSKP